MKGTADGLFTGAAREKGLATLGGVVVVALTHTVLSYLITVVFGYAEKGVLPAVAPAVVFGAYVLAVVAAIVWTSRGSLLAGGASLLGSLALAGDRVFGSGCWVGSGSGFSPVPTSTSLEAGHMVVEIGRGCNLLLNPVLIGAGAVLLAVAVVHAQSER